ncbi:pyridoxal phosphate homeostasis protein [Elsinoe australis]|uniref:Pyridoxal phosphate homeostasis protein n=1 Tax=Elsinoe australis TaxID=40998 RepID=A0A4V6DUT0_9PEZI|nr:pyridoxal phosphate homeostasis protein [Elsinoe australis]
MSADAAEAVEDMHINPQRAKELAENLSGVVQKIQAVNKTGRQIRLIAVSKLKPANDILALHREPASHSDFGENYAQELTEKHSLLPRSIRWHFIGALQTNKCKPLAESIPNLFCVSSVDSTKKADQLEKGRAALAEKEEKEGRQIEELRIQVQVNTSGESEKSGVEPNDATALCKHVREKCPHLKLSGLMTIGAIARSQATTAETENEDFISLRDTRDKVAKELGIGTDELGLSMGMSSDFEGAITQGSDEVRVGTTIFGERPARKDAKIKGDVEEGSK